MQQQLSSRSDCVVSFVLLVPFGLKLKRHVFQMEVKGERSAKVRRFNCGQTGRVVRGEAQRSPLSGDFLMGLDFLRCTYSLGIPEWDPLEFMKSPKSQMPLPDPFVFTMHLICP